MGSSNASKAGTQAAVELISQLHSEDMRRRLQFDIGDRKITPYLEAIDMIAQSAHGEELKEVIFMAVVRLQFEFQTTLTSQTSATYFYLHEMLRRRLSMAPNSVPESSSSMTDSTSDLSWYEDYAAYAAPIPNKEDLDYLRSVAERMNSYGHLGDCVEAYISVRKHFIDSIIERLPLKQLQAGDTRKFSREALEVNTKRWIQAAKFCIELLFPQEKQTAEQIFSGLGNTSIAEESFMHNVKDAVANVFNFAENISSSHQSSERLEIILTLNNAVSSLLPDVNDLFQFESAEGIRNSVQAILSGLHDEVRRMMSDFKNAVLSEVSKISEKVGEVHPLTKYVMEYLNLLVDHRILLMSIIASKPLNTIGSLEFPNGSFQDPGNLSPLALHIVSIIAVLLLKLEDKSKKYKNASFGYLFMANNIQFVIQEIEGSMDLQEMVGTDIVEKLTENVNKATGSFRVLTCEKIWRCLKEEDLCVSWCFCCGVSTSELRKRIKTFNSLFEDAHVLQSSRHISDLNLREELGKLTTETLLPAYGSFLEKFRNRLKSAKGSERSILSFRKISIKYSVEDLGALFLKSHQLFPSQEVPAGSFYI